MDFGQIHPLTHWTACATDQLIEASSVPKGPGTLLVLRQQFNPIKHAQRSTPYPQTLPVGV
eukprot:scaffold11680_cov142-Cylindrotheca_fusiformis.AAC.1